MIYKPPLMRAAKSYYAPIRQELDSAEIVLLIDVVESNIDDRLYDDQKKRA